MTLNEWTIEWLARQRPRTRQTYATGLAYVLRALGTIELKDIARPELRVMLADRPSSEYPIIRACLGAAHVEGLIESNPCANFRLKRKRAQIIEPLSVDDVARLVAAQGPYALLWRTLAHTGVRLGEALGLQSQDVYTSHILVCRSRGPGNDVDVPKSGRHRRVDVPEALASKLLMRASYVDAMTGQGFIFPWTHAHVRYTWYRVCRELGIKARIHALRHTYAATLLVAGAPMPYVKEQLGHASIQMTVDTYGHLVPGTGAEWVRRAFE